MGSNYYIASSTDEVILDHTCDDSIGDSLDMKRTQIVKTETEFYHIGKASFCGKDDNGESATAFIFRHQCINGNEIRAKTDLIDFLTSSHKEHITIVDEYKNKLNLDEFRLRLLEYVSYPSGELDKPTGSTESSWRDKEGNLFVDSYFS